MNREKMGSRLVVMRVRSARTTQAKQCTNYFIIGRIVIYIPCWETKEIPEIPILAMFASSLGRRPSLRITHNYDWERERKREREEERERERERER